MPAGEGGTRGLVLITESAAPSAFPRSLLLCLCERECMSVLEAREGESGCLSQRLRRKRTELSRTTQFAATLPVQAATQCLRSIRTLNASHKQVSLRSISATLPDRRLLTVFLCCHLGCIRVHGCSYMIICDCVVRLSADKKDHQDSTGNDASY